LSLVLAEHPAGARPETFALLALMHLHAARFAARGDGSGGLLLLEEQDRALWDQREIQIGLSWLERSAEGDHFSRYHAEAGIAAEHCPAPSFAETRWSRIVECYLPLERVAPSLLHTLNRAVAVAEWRGPLEGLAVLDGLEPPLGSRALTCGQPSSPIFTAGADTTKSRSVIATPHCRPHQPPR
jgi:RNA polymerase sigma-70 factor (ECF subfamily)